ncbi:MAG: DUF4118 domain-containing protein, partial [Chloroflexi bacterium]
MTPVVACACASRRAGTAASARLTRASVRRIELDTGIGESSFRGRLGARGRHPPGRLGRTAASMWLGGDSIPFPWTGGKAGVGRITDLSRSRLDLAGFPRASPPPSRWDAAADGAMTPSSATPSVQRTREWLRLLARASPDWARIGPSVRGPLLTLAAAVVLDVLRRHEMGLISPFPVLILTVVYSAYIGGLGPALVSVAVTVLDALHYFAQPGLPLHYARESAASLVAVACSALLAGLVVARLHERLRRAEALELSRDEAEALSRRFAFLEQGSLILSSARDFEAVFRDLSRL